MSKSPYPIQRSIVNAVQQRDMSLSFSIADADKTIYRFTLLNPEGRLLAEGFSNTPFAPHWLRQQQAVLNTHHVLDVIHAL